MRAKVLIDNITRNSLAAEWGLSIYIEHEGYKILLDTGTTGKFADNAEAMGIDLEQVDFGVLSHAHYDHSDGMERFFEVNEKAKFYLREGAKENCYGRRWIFSKYIGIKKGYLKKYEDRIIYASGDYEIVPGVMLIPHKTQGLSALGKKNNLYIKMNGRQKPDSFDHEQSLVLDTDEGLVIFNSCSHGGADVIIREIMETFPHKKIYALIGGFHLYHSTDEEVRALAERIRRTGIECICTGHCSGQRGADLLKEELGDAVRQLYTGMEINVGTSTL